MLLGLLEPKDADAQAARVADWLLEDAGAACGIIRGRRGPRAGDGGGHPRGDGAAARSPWSRWRPPRRCPSTTRFRLLAGAGARRWRRARWCSSAGGRAWRSAPATALGRQPGHRHRAAAGAGRAARAGRRCCSARSSGSWRHVPHRMSVTVVNPLQLLRELFTVNGAGTLIRRGSRIDVHDGWDGLDRVRLRALFSSAFGRPSVPTSSTSPIARTFVEEDYRGAAVVARDEGGALPDEVRRRAAGPGRRASGPSSGPGRPRLPRVLLALPPRRTRSPPGTSSSATGSLRFPEWHVFWRGLPVETIEPRGPARTGRRERLRLIRDPQRVPRSPAPPAMSSSRRRLSLTRSSSGPGGQIRSSHSARMTSSIVSRRDTKVARPSSQKICGTRPIET